jgi:two-component system sensor histidine kinase PilS (NtrC family)
MANDFGFILSGILSGFLGNELKRSRIQVEKRETDIKVLEDFNRNIIENIGSGIITTDREGKTSYVNRMAIKILGLSREEMLGKQLEEIIPGLDVNPEKTPGRGERYELPFKRKGGQQMFLGFSFSALRDHEGRELGKILIFQDLTMIKDMEERVKLADRLAMLGELASGLAHEIRNPLASIAGSAQILNDGDDVDDENRVLLEIIEKESSRLNNLIKDFLTFAKPDVKDIENVDLTRLCEEVIKALSVSGASSEKVTFSLDVKKKPFVHGDSEKLKQVIWNLLLNAVQAVGNEGMVTVFVDVKSVQNKRYGCVTFEDTGPGISPDCVDKVFVPFFTTKEGGTGLGLAVTSRLVQFHNGFIKVDKNKRDGARITIYLPEKIDEE